MPEYTLNAPNAAACALPSKVIGLTSANALQAFDYEALRSYTVFAGEVRNEQILHPLNAPSGTTADTVRGTWTVTNPSTCRSMLVNVNFSGLEFYIIGVASLGVYHGSQLSTGTGDKTAYDFGDFDLEQVSSGTRFIHNGHSRGASFNEVIAPGATFSVTLTERIIVGRLSGFNSPDDTWESQGFSISVVGMSI